MHEPIDLFINAKIVFYFPKDVFYTKKGIVSGKLPDLSNLYSIVEDSLQFVGILKNDRLIRQHNGSDRLPSKDDKYSLSITLTKAEQYENVEVKKRGKK